MVAQRLLDVHGIVTKDRRILEGSVDVVDDGDGIMEGGFSDESIVVLENDISVQTQDHSSVSTERVPVRVSSMEETFLLSNDDGTQEKLIHADKGDEHVSDDLINTDCEDDCKLCENGCEQTDSFTGTTNQNHRRPSMQSNVDLHLSNIFSDTVAVTNPL